MDLLKTDFPPDQSNLIYWDIETRSRSDLKRKTGYNYALNNSTEILCSVWVKANDIYIWWGYFDSVDDIHIAQMKESISSLIKDSPFFEDQNLIFSSGYMGLMEICQDILPHPWVAHNGFGFDEKVWRSKFGQFFPPYVIDSMGLFRRCGLPAGLNQIGKYLFGAGKHQGSKTLSMISKPMKKGHNKGVMLPVTWNSLSMVVAYCVVDVLIMKKAMEQEVWPFCHQPIWEDRMYWLDKAINDKGFKIDVPMSKKLINVEEKLREQTGQSVEELVAELILSTGEGKKVAPDKQSGRAFLRSTNRVHEWLKLKHGIELENLRKDTVIEFLAENEVHPDVELVLLARLGESSITTAKVKRALYAAHHADHRVRGALAYNSAHTKRWGGRVNQPHNMARGHIDLDLDKCMEKLEGGFQEINSFVSSIDCSRNLDLYKNPNPPRVSDFLAIQVRPTVKASEGHEFAIIDLKSVEARGISYLADDQKGLEIYRKGLDPYKNLAVKLFNVDYSEVTGPQRFIGKTGELGSGYGMGEQGAYKYLMSFGLDPDKLKKFGITPRKIIETYRNLHTALAGTIDSFEAEDEDGNKRTVTYRKGGLWKDLDKVIKAVAASSHGARMFCAKCVFTKYKNHMFVQLPSGTKLIYRRVRLGKRKAPWDPSQQMEVVFFDGYKNGQMLTNHTYGGKIAENITQAFTRDILAFKMVEVYVKLLLIPSLHVHDEGLWEIKTGDKETFFKLLRILSTPPKFCPDFPLAVEGFMSPIYRKKPSKKLGQREYEASLGKIIGVDHD